MDVQMAHCLAGRRSVVDANGVVGRVELLIDYVPHIAQESKQVEHFSGRQIKHRNDMAFRNDQRMAWSCRCLVPLGVAERCVTDDLFREFLGVTERAGFAHLQIMAQIFSSVNQPFA